MKIKNLSIIFLLLFTSDTFAGITDDLNSFFTNLGYEKNLSGASTYHDQAAGYYSGGSMVLRNRVRNIQLVEIDMPRFKAGCGGIDMFLGGFSFINTENLTKFFQQVMSNAVGYSFNLALETAVPEIAHAMQYMQRIAQEINNNNFNSCETAESLVGGLWPRTKAAQQHICRDLGNSRGLFNDWAEARQKCGGSDNDYNDKMNKAAADSEYKKAVIINKNLIWDIIIGQGFLSEDKQLAELFMSLSGTFVFDAAGKVKIYSSLAKDHSVIKAMLAGGSAKIYRCDEDTKCLHPSLRENAAISKDHALYVRVEKILNDIVLALTSEGSGSAGLSPKIQGFLALTKLPILKFITTQLMLGRPALALSITNYSEAIAKSLLIQYLGEAIQTVKDNLYKADYPPEIAMQLHEQIQQTLVHVESIKTESRKDIQELISFINSAKTTEKEVTAKILSGVKL